MEMNLFYLEKLKTHINQIIELAKVEIRSFEDQKKERKNNLKELDRKIHHLNDEAAEKYPYISPYSYPTFRFSAGKLILWGIIGFFAGASVFAILLMVAFTGFAENAANDGVIALPMMLSGGLGFLVAFIILKLKDAAAKKECAKINALEVEHAKQEMPKLEALRNDWIKNATKKLETQKDLIRNKIAEIDQSIANVEAKIANFVDMKNDIDQQKEEISDTLKTAYDTDIIYPKYRSLIPVTMFCEYIASGRCTALQGHEGAYNIYENESRLNLIITKLDNVVSSLNNIQNNQHLLYTGINEITQNILALKNSTDIQTAILSNSRKIMADKADMLLSLQSKHIDEIKKLAEKF